jgi:3-hydroxyisobutyrate dehydrogenase
MRRDLCICLDEAKFDGIKLPLTESVVQEYSNIQEQDLGRMDMSYVNQSD